MTSQWFQLARVSAFCSGVAVPKTRPWIFSGEGAVVHKLMTMMSARQMTSIQPQKKSQFTS